MSHLFLRVFSISFFFIFLSFYAFPSPQHFYSLSFPLLYLMIVNENLLLPVKLPGSSSHSETTPVSGDICWSYSCNKHHPFFNGSYDCCFLMNLLIARSKIWPLEASSCRFPSSQDNIELLRRQRITVWLQSSSCWASPTQRGRKLCSLSCSWSSTSVHCWEICSSS